MSEKIVNPLIDAVIIQLTAIRGALGESHAVFLIDGAKAQLTAAKQMIGAPELIPPRRQAPRPSAEAEREQLALRPQLIEPEDIKRKYVKKNGKSVDPEALRKAVIKLLKESERPLGRRQLEQRLKMNAKRFRLPADLPISPLRQQLKNLTLSGEIIRSGHTSAIVYTVDSNE